MAITYGQIGPIATTSIQSPQVFYPNTVTAGQLAVLVIHPKLGPTSQPDFSADGWTARGFISHGTTASANDAGSMRGMAWTRECTGTEGGTTYTANLGVIPPAGQAYIFTLNKASNMAWDIAFVGVARTATTTAWSVTAGSNPGLTSGDFVLVSNAVPTDLATAASAGSLTATGLTSGTATRRQAFNGSSSGSDSAIWADSFSPTAGTASAAPTYASTITGGTNLYGVAAFVRFREVAGAANLVVADGSHGHAADAVAVTQVHVVAVADGSHAHSVDSPALVQTSLLVVADAGHGHTADTVTLDSAASLVVVDGSHAHSADAVALTQVHGLAAADGGHGHTADAVGLTQAHSLGVADSGHGHAADGVAVAQTHVVAVADATHAHAADVVTLAVGGASLAVADAGHAHTADVVTLTQLHALATAEALHTLTSDTLALGQVHVLSVADGLHAHTADPVAFAPEQSPGEMHPRTAGVPQMRARTGPTSTMTGG